MSELTKIKFKADYSPRKKGEVVELETKLANYYLTIGVAETPCEGCEDKPCTECEKLIQADLQAKQEENKQTKTKKK